VEGESDWLWRGWLSTSLPVSSTSRYAIGSRCCCCFILLHMSCMPQLTTSSAFPTPRAVPYTSRSSLRLTADVGCGVKWKQTALHMVVAAVFLLLHHQLWLVHCKRIHTLCVTKTKLINKYKTYKFMNSHNYIHSEWTAAGTKMLIW